MTTLDAPPAPSSETARVQDLAIFRVPPGFRGRSVIVVQLWWIIQSTLFSWSPQVLYGWRAWLLRLFGAKIGHHVLIRPGVRITYPWHLGFCRRSGAVRLRRLKTPLLCLHPRHARSLVQAAVPP